MVVHEKTKRAYGLSDYASLIRPTFIGLNHRDIPNVQTHETGEPVQERGAPGMARPSPTWTYSRAFPEQVPPPRAARQLAGY